ncbi:serine/threonine-protein kinase [Kitasatospora sp. NPDC088391]|uniref:serine/threonine-protein kinase n=1 Tax=Kitasatospora sp. NPDC088391 TaxID=3364074 RepID=UPI003816E9DA
MIGRGGMAVVYRAEDLRLGRTVAVKLLAPELARNENFRQRFVRESRVAASLDHPNIVPVYDAGEAEGVLYLAMRYVRGRDLRGLLDRQGPLTIAQTVRITVQVASALDTAHAHELVHRDVKPGNVLIAEGTDPDHPEHAYLTDFGLTKKSLSLTGLTSVGQFVGTLDYVAPEQISGKPVDGRCDVYSLGCVVFEMLTGGPPYRRDDDLALLWAHLNDPPPSVLEQRADLPPGVGAALERAMAKRPEERHGSCLEFTAALRAAAAPVPEALAAASGSGSGSASASAGPVAGVAAGPVAVARAGDRRPEPPLPPEWARPVYEPGRRRS